MGKEILYCDRCGKKLVSDDFTRGRAHTILDRSYCAACVPHRLDPEAKKSTTRRIVKPPSTARIAAATRSKPQAPLIIAVTVCAVLVVVLVFALRSAPPPAPVAAPPKPPPPPPVAAPTMPEALKRARTFASKEGDVDEAVELWREAVKACDNTLFAIDAKASLDRALARRKEVIAAELKALKERIAPYPRSEQFGAAIDLLEEARRRHDSPEWTDPIDLMVVDIRQAAGKQFKAVVVPKALDAKARGASAELVDLKDRLNRWGVAMYAAELDRELATALPPPVPIPAGGLVLMKFPPGDMKNYRTFGKVQDGALWAIKDGKAFTAGFEHPAKGIFHFPKEGEFRFTYLTNNPRQIQLICRVVLEEGKSRGYVWHLRKPEVGKLSQAVARLQDFRDWNNNLVQPGMLVNNIYLQVEDAQVEFKLTEVSVVKLKD